MTRMMLIIWLMVHLAVPTRARLQDLWKLDDSAVGEGIMKTIFEACYKHHEKVNPIIIIGEFKGSINGASIIRMDDSLIIDENYKPNGTSYNGATKVVLVEHSLKKLQSDLKLLKQTQWWDHISVFFIIGNGTDGCSNFKNILRSTWWMDIINSIYICPESTNAAELYTLNPITNYAPHPWKRMEEFNYSNIYRQTFDPKISCENLNYDKTRRLDGYRIRAYLPGTKKDQKFNNCLINALNASYDAIKDSTNVHATFVDIDTYYVFQYAPGRELRLFPHELWYFIAVVKTDEISTLQKIYNLWSPQVLHLAMISLIIFLLVLVVRNADIVSGILDIVRLINSYQY